MMKFPDVIERWVAAIAGIHTLILGVVRPAQVCGTARTAAVKIDLASSNTQMVAVILAVLANNLVARRSHDDRTENQIQFKPFSAGICQQGPNGVWCRTYFSRSGEAGVGVYLLSLPVN